MFPRINKIAHIFAIPHLFGYLFGATSALVWRSTLVSMITECDVLRLKDVAKSSFRCNSMQTLKAGVHSEARDSREYISTRFGRNGYVIANEDQLSKKKRSQAD